jgi:uncharacterized membrane protein
VRLRVAIAIVALVGGGIAVYLTTVHYEHVAPICTSGGCEKVQRSSYAELAGIPVAVLGLAGYVLLLASVAVRGTGAALAGAFLALTGTVFSGYLLWAQLERIHAICIWCVGNDVAMALLAVLCSARFLREPASP